ncbi:MAG: 6-phosphofructokinase [Oscillospiraceae bacterium]
MYSNVIVGQSGGPTAVINASLAGVYMTAQSLGLGKVYGMLHGVEGLLKEQYIDMSEEIRGRMDIELLKRTPSSYLGSCRYKLPLANEDEKVYQKLFSILKKLDIGYFIYIGGNDSMDTISKLTDYAKAIGSGIRFMGVPKTIDNDLVCTDHTPGYGSAAKYIAATIKEIVRDSLVYDVKSVTLVEIMGRNAGWLTGAAGLAKGEDCEGVDMIYLPETVFDETAFLAKISERQRDKKSLVIAISEGIKLANGEYVCNSVAQHSKVDMFGHKPLSGTAKYLETIISDELRCKARAIELNTLQRCCAHMASRVDITEAYQVGGAAIQGAAMGLTGQMALLTRVSEMPYVCSTGFADIHGIANREKLVPHEWIDETSQGVTSGFLNYARPLIQAEITPIYVDGLPSHLVIR